MATIPLKEGDSEPFSLVVFEGYAVINWNVVSGTAKLGSDFNVTPPNGNGVIVNAGEKFDITFEASGLLPKMCRLHWALRLKMQLEEREAIRFLEMVLPTS